MAVYFITYDLRKKRDYKKLYDELENFEAVRVLESIWCFKRINTTTAKLRNHFKKFIDQDDGLLLVEANSWATSKVDASPKKF